MNNNNPSANSECSSGCESGWTVYFDEPSNSYCQDGKQGYSRYFPHDCQMNIEDDDEEDLSMVSDASSGPPPPHPQDFQQFGNCGMMDDQSCPNYYGFCNYYSASGHHQHQLCDERKPKNNLGRTKEKNNNDMKKKKKNSLCLDDTATSPFFHFVKDNVSDDYHDSVGISPPHFEDDSISKKHLGFFKSSKKGKPGSFLGRKRQ